MKHDELDYTKERERLLRREVRRLESENERLRTENEQLKKQIRALALRTKPKGDGTMKYYAVRKGRVPGIYDNWPDCEAQVRGFGGAEYKSFKDKASAEAYIANPDPSGDAARTANADGDNTGYEYPFAFVDGSFNPETKAYGCGGFLSVSQYESYEITGCDYEPEMASMRNVAGEIMGATIAIRKAIFLGLETLTIYYDYMGIEKWATGEWKRNKPGTQRYYETVQDAMSKISLKFVHVDAHTGIPGNELADKMAKRAVEIEVRDDG